MARLITCGFEVQDAGSATVGRGEGQSISAINAPTIVTGTVRSGLAALQCTNTSAAVRWQTLGVTLGATVYVRAYFNFSAFPSGATGNLIEVQTSAAGKIVSAIITSGGQLRLFNNVGGAQVGPSSAALNVGQWYRIELSCMVPASGNGSAELLLDGVSITQSSALSIGATAIDRTVLGWATTPTVGTLYVDDVAVNDSTGAAQNGYPGPGKIALLKPVADSSRVGWTAGAAGTTSLFSAVDNTPPVGVADASATIASQIRDAAANVTDAYAANVGAYSAAVAASGGGMSAGDTVSLVQSIVNIGPKTAAACQVGQSVVSNPAVAENVPAATAATAVAAYPTGWTTQRGTITYAPSVTLATQPVVQVRKATSAVTIDVDLVGLYVEFPGPVSLAGAGSNASTSAASLSEGISLAGTGTSASTSVATLTVTLPLAAVGQNAAVSTGNLSVTVQLVAASGNLAASTAALTLSTPLAGAGTSISASIANFIDSTPLAGVGFNASTSTATLSTSTPLAGTGSNDIASSAGLSVAMPLAGAGANSTTASAGLSLGGSLQGVGLNASTSTGALSVSIPFTGTGQNVSSGTGTLAIVLSLSGQGTNNTQSIAEVKLSIALNGVSANFSSSTSNFTVGRILAGNGVNTTVSAGTIIVTMTLIGSSVNVSRNTAALNIAVPLSGFSNNISTADGSLATFIPLDGIGVSNSFSMGTLNMLLVMTGIVEIVGSISSTGIGEQTSSVGVGQVASSGLNQRGTGVGLGL